MADFNAIRFQPSRPLLREVTADRLNTICAEIRRNRPKGERGITVRHSGDGTYIGLASSTGKGGAAIESHPFQIEVTSPEEDEYQATIRPGTINSILPSGILDGAELQLYDVGSSLKYIVLTATSSSGQITSAQISAEDSAPAAQEPAPFSLPTQAKFLLGITMGANVFQIVQDNLSVGGKLQYTESRVAGVGELPYTTYYVWG